MNWQQLHTNIQSILTPVYEAESELLQIIHILFEKRISERYKYDLNTLAAAIIIQIEKDVAQLQLQKPIQYILEEAWFYKYPFYVNEHTLIPRPETEELVFTVLDFCKKNNLKSVLDIGTGSGCIAISIKKERADITVHAVDVSLQALRVAQKNANDLHAEINFIELDILTAAAKDLPQIDLIVSNPPYIPKTELMQMQANVLDYEPHIALFVEDEDPLLFYRKIAILANALNIPAIVEISENKGPETLSLFQEYFKAAILLKDMQQKDRIIVATP